MSVHTAYEVRVFRKDDWQIEAVLDDEPLAIAAARKIEARLDKVPVVVVQEVYDAARNHLKSRSVYRSEPAVRPATSGDARPQTSKTRPASKASANDQVVRAERPAPAHSTANPVNSHLSWALFGLLVAALAAYGILKSLGG